jgi:RNA polymerase sigma factor (sigma-70 family)
METRQLVKNCIDNNRQAQQQLYAMYASNMLGLCYRYTKSLHDAEDILQEGFLKVYSKLHQYKFEGELGAWIRKIMVNTALTYINKHSKYKHNFNINNLALHPIETQQPDINVNIKDMVECIRKLPTAQQTVFNLVAVEGYNHIEVAQMLQTNVNTIRSQFSRGKSLLIKIIEDENILTNNLKLSS